ncbi:hypothetical protein VIGAN_04229700 [Vigna angularis var. angularis]|uniref:Uncharacterized protein n=1 Tax=Vigna angularis var. angularis TaxID=157739 RepID=A0A0S3RW54_PHAAN|nr:hypothetical protein VIGAN_04229700 [Vigna angularis var. angularis]
MAALRKCDSSVFSPLMAVRGGLSGSFRCAGRPYPFLFLFLARDAREVARVVARKALMVVAMGVKVVGVDNSVLADLE